MCVSATVETEVSLSELEEDQTQAGLGSDTLLRSVLLLCRQGRLSVKTHRSNLMKTTTQ